MLAKSWHRHRLRGVELLPHFTNKETEAPGQRDGTRRRVSANAVPRA